MRDFPLPPGTSNSGDPANVAALEPQTQRTRSGISGTALNSISPIRSPLSPSHIYFPTLLTPR